jgi:hypothetical protein
VGRSGETGGMPPECARRWQLLGAEESNLDNHSKLVFRLDTYQMLVAAMPLSVDLLILDEKHIQPSQQLELRTK